MKKYVAGILTVVIPLVFSLYVPEIRELLGLPDIYVLIKDREELVLKVDDLNDKLRENTITCSNLIAQKDSAYKKLETQFNELSFDIEHIDNKFISINDLFDNSNGGFLNNLNTILDNKQNGLINSVPCTQLKLTNNSDTKIYVSAHYKNVFDIWVTEGWWGVKPNETVNTNIYIKDSYFYIHAHGGEYKWEGEYEYISSDNKFLHLEEYGLIEKINKVYKYSKHYMGNGNKYYTLSFTINQ